MHTTVRPFDQARKGTTASTAAPTIPGNIQDEQDTIPLRRATADPVLLLLRVEDFEPEVELGAVDELAVVPLGALLLLLEVKSPTMTPLAGMTVAFELREFWYGAAPESWAAEMTFQPLDFMLGYASMNALTD